MSYKSVERVYQLIQSLSLAEKRRFSSRATKLAQKGRSNYDRHIYDFLKSLKSFDPDKFQKRFGSLSASFLSSTLRKIREDIYEIVLLENEPVTKRSEAFRHYQFAQSLADRGLYEEARSSLKKARKSAEKIEDFNTLAQIIRLERKELLKGNGLKRKQELEELIAESREVQRKIEVLSRYQELTDLLFLEARERYALRVTDPGDLAARLDIDWLFRPEMPHMCFESYRLHYHCLSLWARISGNAKDNYQANLNMVAHWENHDEMIRSRTKEYKKSMSNLLAAGHDIKDYSKFPDILTKIRDIPCLTEEEKAEEFCALSTFEYLQAINTGRSEATGKLESKILNWLAENEHMISPARALTFKFNIALWRASKRNWQGAAPLLRDIHDSWRPTQRADIQIGVCIFYPFVIAESGDTEFAERYARIGYERIRRMGKKDYPLEDAKEVMNALIGDLENHSRWDRLTAILSRMEAPSESLGFDVLKQLLTE